MTAGDLREIAQSYLKKLEDLMAYEDRCALPDLSSPHCGHPWVLITYDKMCCPQKKEKVVCKPWYLHHYIGLLHLL